MDEYLEIARRGRNGWHLYAATCLAGTLLAVGISIVIFLALLFSGAAPPDLAQQLTNPTRPAAFFPATGVMFASFALGFVLAARWIQRKRLGDLVGRWRWEQFAAGALFWVLVVVLVASIDWALDPDGFRITASSATPQLALFALIGLAPQIFAEELVFRGLLTQGLLLALKRPLPAAILSGLIFGSVHIPNGLPQAASATVFGVVTALIAIRTGGIALTTGVHLVNNLFGAVVVVSAHDVFRGAPALLTQDSPQLMWVDVSLGVAGLLALLVVSLGLFGRKPAGSGPAEVFS